ncbi:MAG: hypothetical protein DRI90_02180 [Deltaproteobacteria bacterium]|nr:MAG: hypothetical protein DRI90_02180 [Deltaproteobacteria bacterium]
MWIALAGLAGVVGGCGTEDADPTTSTGGSGGSGGTDPGPRPPGGQCSCDADCEGDLALCLLGICMQQAAAPCDVPNSELGCAPGFRCFNTDILPGIGVCWPPYDEATCDGVENRYGLCSPVRGDLCDSMCGGACVPDSIAPAAIGSACNGDKQCAVCAEPRCYEEADNKVDRFIDGYCMWFGCTADADCGADAICPPLAADGSGVCLNHCGMDLDCRSGYRCRYFEEETATVCWGGCDAAATCPEGYLCAGEYCIDEQIACSADNPYGECPTNQWCKDGVCTDEQFVCSGDEVDSLEPNDTLQAAVAAPNGVTEGLTICEDDEDWFEIVVPAATILRVGIEFMHAAGDVDLVIYDDAGVIFASRVGSYYPYGEDWRDANETDPYCSGVCTEAGSDTSFVRVLVAGMGQNQYSLHIDEFPYVDGPDCQAAGFTSDECAGHGADGTGLLPFPFADPNDSFLGAGYWWETPSNYRFARRELIMLIRNAIQRTMEAFPGTTPLGIGDTCQFDGITPGYDMDDPRHPESTHDQGGNIDVAYFQTDGQNDMEIVCNDGSVHNDGFCSSAAATVHTVDLPRHAFFMAQLFASPRLRVVGVDQVIGPLIEQAADDLFNLAENDPQKISSAELAAFSSEMAYGSGWPFHHHHIHISLNWWSSADQSSGATSGPSDSDTQASMFAPGIEPVNVSELRPLRSKLAWPLPSVPLP